MQLIPFDIYVFDTYVFDIYVLGLIKACDQLNWRNHSDPTVFGVRQVLGIYIYS